MEITFEKTITTTLNIDPIAIAKIAVDEYINEYEVLDDGIYDYIGDNIFYYIEKLDIPSEDCEALVDSVDLEDSQLDQLCNEINNYIEQNYNVKTIL